MKTVIFVLSTAGLALAGPARAELAPHLPELAAAMTVFEGETARELQIKLRPDRKMTVFTPNGTREVALDEDWPLAPVGAGWLALSSGPRRDHMRFNIGGKGNPDILSELDWRVPAWQIRADGGWSHRSGATLKGYLAYARSRSAGEVRDSDYALDGRRAEFSRSLADASDSEMFDILLGAGWRLPLGRAALIPQVGIARYAATYRSSNGRQVVSDSANALLLGISDWRTPLGPFAGLNSVYRPVWNSLWLGVDAEIPVAGRAALRAALRHHWFDYQAEADWNLRRDFAHPLSFRQRDRGTGWEATLGGSFHLAHGHHLSLEASARQMQTRQGKDTSYFANGASSTLDLGQTVLDSWSIQLGYRYEF